MTLSVKLLPVGRGEVPGPEVFWMRDWDRWCELQFQAVLIRGDGITALVNTGPAADLAPMNQQWASFLGERAAMRRAEGEFILDQLAANGVAPADVTHLLLTPLQLYTVSNVPAFPNAEICLTERGWQHFHRTHRHPHDDRDSSLPPEVLQYLMTEAWPRVRLLADEDALRPDLRTWWSGGHHRASMVIEVDTAAGVVAISDTYFHLANVTEPHPVGISENIYEALDCYQRVRETADIVLPLYDPDNLVRFPDGRIG